MLITLAVVLLIVFVLLVLITIVQTFYLESLRLRRFEAPAQAYFKESLEPKLGFRAEQGALTFSIIKHTLLPILGVCFLGLRIGHEPPSWLRLAEATVFSAATMFLSSYLIPHVLYRKTEGHWLLPLVPVLRVLALLFRPVTGLLAFLQSLVQLGEPETSVAETPTTQENIEALLTAGTEEGTIEAEHRKLIQSAAAFGLKTVREVMTARPAIVAVPVTATLADLRQLVITEQFSRIPVYESNIDSIIGFVHVRDMFEIDEKDRKTRNVRDLVRPLSFVPESKPVDDLLREMQQEGNHLAIVVDEYGNTAGLVTMEDMVEELVGEIRDEHEPALDVQQDEKGGYIVSGSFDVDHLADLISYRPNGDTEATTIGGLATEWAGHVPQVGEKIEHEGVCLEVLAGNELRVDQVRISRAEPAADDNA